MAEDGTKAMVKGIGILKYFTPHIACPPVCITYWQGIVEMIGRGVLLILVFILFATSSAAVDDTEELVNAPNTGAFNGGNARSAAGWTIFMGIVVLVYELAFIASRFLNLEFMTAFRTIVLFTDIIFNSVCSLLMFAGAVSLAYYAEVVRDYLSVDNRGAVRILANTLGAAAFFAFAVIFALIFLAVWMGLYYFLRWDIKRSTSNTADE